MRSAGAATTATHIDDARGFRLISFTTGITRAETATRTPSRNLLSNLLHGNYKVLDVEEEPKERPPSPPKVYKNNIFGQLRQRSVWSNIGVPVEALGGTEPLIDALSPNLHHLQQLPTSQPSHLAWLFE